MPGQKSDKWRIVIQGPFTGFVPAYWENSNPLLGNSNQAAAMSNVDLIDPNAIGQGPGLAGLTNGSQAGAVTTLLKGIMRTPSSSDLTFGIGGNKFYRFSSTTVTSGSADSITWPFAFDLGGVTGEDGESVLKYGGKIYGFYNHSGGGDILRYDLAGTIITGWASTTPTGAASLNNAPHPSIVGGDDVMYYGNGRYVGYYDKDTGVGGTLATTALDIDQDGQVVDVGYKDSRVLVAMNVPNLTGNNACKGRIYYWRGVGASSWDDQPLVIVNGRIGAILVDNGSVFVWYEKIDPLRSNLYTLGVVNGNRVEDIQTFTGTLPLYYQVGTYGNLLQWVSNGLIYLWGSADRKSPASFMQFADGGHATAGGLAAPFGTPIIASTDGGTNFTLGKLSGYDTSASWTSVTFDVYRSVIDRVKAYFESTATGSRCDVIIQSNKAGTATTLQKSGETGSISHTNDSSKISKFFDPKIECEDFRVKLDWSNGSSTNNQKIRKIVIEGHWLEKA